MSERYIWNTSYIALRVWNQMKPCCLAVMSANFYCVEKLKYFQDFNGIWTGDLAIPVRCSNQRSYEAADVGSWSLLSSQLPLISNFEWKIYMKYIIYCTAGMKSNETMLSRSDERKFLLRREAWKIFRTSTGFEPATSRYRCDALTNWAMKPLTLAAGHFWVHNFPW